MLENITHCSRRDVCVFLSRRDDDCLDLRSKTTVGIRYGPLGLEVDHITHTTYYMTYASFATCVYGEIVVFDNCNTLKTFCSPTATTTSSNMVRALFRILRCPAVKGSNDPGNNATRFISVNIYGTCNGFAVKE